MTRSPEPSPTLRALRKQIARAHGPLFRLAALASDHGLLTEDELNAFKLDNKAGGERKVFTVAKAEHVLAAYAKWEVTFGARLAEHHISVPAGPANEPQPARRIPMLAERPVDTLPDFQKRQIVVGELAAGSTARQALKRAGLKVTRASRRWAQRLHRTQQQRGDLNDQRRLTNGAAVTVLRPEMKSLIEVLWMQRKRLSCSGLRQMIERHVANLQARLLAGDQAIDRELLGADVRAGQVMLPCSESIRLFVRSLGEWKDHVRRYGWAEHTRQQRPTGRIPWAQYANQEWQADHTPLDLWAKVEHHGVWVAVLLYLTVVLDTFSRGVMGLVVSARYPDAFTTAHALRMSILPKDQSEWVSRGTPERLVLDNGKDFRSIQVSAIAAALDIKLAYCAPRTPDEKPHIERFFGTLTTQLLPQLPGYKHDSARGTPWSATRVSELLTVAQVRTEILRWVQDEYHSTLHGEAKDTPMELWANTAVRRGAPPVRELDILLLYEQTRKVSRGVVRLTLPGMGRGIYWSPALTRRGGQHLVVKYNPDDLASIYAYDATTGQFVDELWNIYEQRSPYSDKDVRSAWWAMLAAEKTRIAELAERIPTYFAESATQDRVMKRATGKDMVEARATAADVAARQAAEEEAAPAALDDETQDDLRAYRDHLVRVAAAHSQPDPTEGATDDASSDAHRRPLTLTA